jgi:hypothetical protein
MKKALSIAFTLYAGAAFAHPSFLPHEHPHDWSVLPGADMIMVAAFALGVSAAVLAYVKR